MKNGISLRRAGASCTAYQPPSRQSAQQTDQTSKRHVKRGNVKLLFQFKCGSESSPSPFHEILPMYVEQEGMSPAEVAAIWEEWGIAYARRIKFMAPPGQFPPYLNPRSDSLPLAPEAVKVESSKGMGSIVAAVARELRLRCDESEVQWVDNEDWVPVKRPERPVPEKPPETPPEKKEAADIPVEHSVLPQESSPPMLPHSEQAPSPQAPPPPKSVQKVDHLAASNERIQQILGHDTHLQQLLAFKAEERRQREALEKEEENVTGALAEGGKRDEPEDQHEHLDGQTSRSQRPQRPTKPLTDEAKERQTRMMLERMARKEKNMKRKEERERTGIA